MVFTRKEKGLLYDPYFAVIRETEQFIEVRSLNTGHCWNVFKNTIESGKRVTLYHKHKQSDPYYHQHRICRSVEQAVNEIMSHDDYVLEQATVKVQKEEKDLQVRKLKVYEASGHDYKTVPQIRLQGNWLRDCGFKEGTLISVIIRSGKIEIISDDI